MNNTILSTLSTEDKNKSFVTIFKDGASFDVKLSDLFATIVVNNITFLSLTTTEINAIVNPQESLTVWNTTLKVLCFYDGSGWRKVSHTTM
jgi:hypothetical protein